MRALAVVLVLLYHADVPGFGGGFIGVDVFLVVSGFLITGLLVDEAATTGTIRLRDFYARRVRRLLPASALVAIVTLLWAGFVYSPLAMIELRREALATVTYLANFHFAQRGTDYLADASVSPFLHYWSLALEEQFYLLWPVLVLGVAQLVRRLGRDLEEYVFAALLITTAGSLAASGVVTPVRPPTAYFLLHARAWEFAAGGILALVVRRRGLARGTPARLALVVGLCAIGIAATTFDRETVFPGLAALLPVVGTTAALYGGAADQPLRKALAAPASRWLGQRSYSTYLWHWPVLVLAGPGMGLAGRLVLVLVSITLAHWTFRLIESPIRYHPGLLRPSRAVALGMVTTCVAITVGLAVTSTRVLDTGVTAQSVTTDSLQRVLGETTDLVPVNLRPTLVHAREALPEVYRDGCHRNFLDTSVTGCVYGAEQAQFTVFLVGDSHAVQWFPAFQLISEARGWRLVSMTKSSCSAIDAPAYLRQFDRPYPECEAWLSKVYARVAEESPDIVVVASNSHGGRHGHSAPVYLDGLQATLQRLTATSHVLMVGGTPVHEADVPTCLSANLRTAAACITPLDRATDPDIRAGEPEAARRAGAAYISMTPLLCPGDRCPVIAGDVLVYRDSHHLTPEFVGLLAPLLESELIPLTGAEVLDVGGRDDVSAASQ